MMVSLLLRPYTYVCTYVYLQFDVILLAFGNLEIAKKIII